MKSMNAIVGQIDKLADECRLIQTNPDGWWKARQQKLCKHENIITENVIESVHNPENKYGYGEIEGQVAICEDCGKELGMGF